MIPRTCGRWWVLVLIAFACSDNPTKVVGPPAQLQVVSGSQQTGPVAEVLAEPLVVRVADMDGNPVAGIQVTFSPGAGSAQPATVATGSNGEVATRWTLGTTAGLEEMQVQAEGMLVTISATASAAAPAAVVFVNGRGQAGTREEALPFPLAVRVTDTYGNATVGVDVTFEVSDGGTIAPSMAATDTDGRAQATWTLGSALGSQTATASVSQAGSDTASALSTVAMTVLDHVVVDAVYDSVGDRLITVSADPDRLNVIDPTTAQETSVALDLTPAAVSVQPDGRYAAVGHNAFISYVNLSTMTVERVYPVTADVLDLELPGNGWVYAFPRRDQWETIRSIDLATGNETQTGTIYAGTRVKLHPSGQYIYGADNGISPSDFEKYDIRAGSAVYLYDSPYHGGYSFGGDLWMYQTGTRIIARSGNVFTSSSVQSQDMLYAGSITTSFAIASAAQSVALQRVLVVRSAGYTGMAPSELQSYTDTFLAARGSVALPPYVEGGPSTATQYPSEGRFVFIHPAAARVYVLLRGAPPYEGRYNTALAVYRFEDIP